MERDARPLQPDPRPREPDNLVDDELGADAAHDRPQAPRPHGGIRDTGHADFFEIDHRYLPDPVDPLDQPERRQVVDDYGSQVMGAGSHTQAPIGGTDPGAEGRRSSQPDAEPGST